MDLANSQHNNRKPDRLATTSIYYRKSDGLDRPHSNNHSSNGLLKAIHIAITERPMDRIERDYCRATATTEIPMDWPTATA